MTKFSALFAGVLSLAVAFPDHGHAQSISVFPHEKVCVPPGVVSATKLQEAAGVDANKFLQGQRFDLAGYNQAYSIKLTFFASNLQLEKGRFYTVEDGDRTVPTINVERFVAKPSSYKISCVGYGRAKSEAAAVREALATTIGEAGKKLILRKDVDNLEKKLSAAAPAQFSVTRIGLPPTLPSNRNSHWQPRYL